MLKFINRCNWVLLHLFDQKELKTDEHKANVRHYDGQLQFPVTTSSQLTEPEPIGGKPGSPKHCHKHGKYFSSLSSTLPE